MAGSQPAREDGRPPNGPNRDNSAGGRTSLVNRYSVRLSRNLPHMDHRGRHHFSLLSWSFVKRTVRWPCFPSYRFFHLSGLLQPTETDRLGQTQATPGHDNDETNRATTNPSLRHALDRSGDSGHWSLRSAHATARKITKSSVTLGHSRSHWLALPWSAVQGRRVRLQGRAGGACCTKSEECDGVHINSFLPQPLDVGRPRACRYTAAAEGIFGTRSD